MPDFWFFLTSTALFDSLSTALQILIFLYLLSARRPVATALSFLAGMSLSYLACGLLFLGHIEEFNRFLAQFFPPPSLSDPQYYLVQLVFGALCVVGAWYFWRRNQRRTGPNMADRMSLLLRLLNPVTAALVGVLFSVSGFPASLPYLGALEKLSAAFGPSGAIPGALYYNVIYVVPVLIPFVLYLILRHRVEDIEAKLHLQGQKWASVANYGLTAVLGLLFLVDSTVYFSTGRALLSNKFF